MCKMFTALPRSGLINNTIMSCSLPDRNSLPMGIVDHNLADFGGIRKRTKGVAPQRIRKVTHDPQLLLRLLIFRHDLGICMVHLQLLVGGHHTPDSGG